MLLVEPFHTTMSTFPLQRPDLSMVLGALAFGICGAVQFVPMPDQKRTADKKEYAPTNQYMSNKLGDAALCKLLLLRGKLRQ